MNALSLFRDKDAKDQEVYFLLLKIVIIYAEGISTFELNLYFFLC